MEKDSGHYCYEPYTGVSKSATSTLKKGDAKSEKSSASSSTCCKCLSSSRKTKSRAFLTGLATNLGICVLLFGYTLIGSVIFLAIEGGNGEQHQILATTSLATNMNYNKRSFNTSDFKLKTDEFRARTVENIWDITVSLNILYRDNWTRLAAQEITRFQDEILKSIAEENANPDFMVEERKAGLANEHFEWTFAKSFLYSLTVLTTIGYGSIAPKTTLGKAVTMGYAIFGIPLTLLYLSSVGSILSRIARGVFSRALCCCLCSNCGYCCYDEKRMAEKERRMKKKRQQLELQQQLALQEPFYVRSNSGFSASTTNNLHSPIKDVDSISGTDNESKASIHGLAILAPILLCLCIMFVYICIGTFVLYKLENWRPLDGFYFCFMSLTTIGFGNMLPGGEHYTHYESGTTTIWFCSLYIMSGMALTAMCFNVVHDEIVHRLKHEEKIILGRRTTSASYPDDLNTADPYNLAS